MLFSGPDGASDVDARDFPHADFSDCDDEGELSLGRLGEVSRGSAQVRQGCGSAHSRSGTGRGPGRRGRLLAASAQKRVEKGCALTMKAAADRLRGSDPGFRASVGLPPCILATRRRTTKAQVAVANTGARHAVRIPIVASTIDPTQILSIRFVEQRTA